MNQRQLRAVCGGRMWGWIVGAALLLPASALAVDADGDGFDEGEDCADDNPLVNPDATEIIGNIWDDDCDGVAACYADLDFDGFGDPENILYYDWYDDGFECVGDRGAANGEDCDDTNRSINPFGVEICDNSVDEDCDGLDSELMTWFEDFDEDGVGSGEGFEACDPDGYYVPVGGDCDDYNADAYPGNDVIIGDEWDNDCDGRIECFDDADADTYGDPSTEVLFATLEGTFGICEEQSGGTAVSNDLDCDDSQFEVNPDAYEKCNGLDDNCNDDVDEGYDTERWYLDDDGDGYGREEYIETCDEPPGTAETPGDCNDRDGDIHPAARDEWYDGVDSNCDGQDDYDQDRDGWDVYDDCDDLDSSVQECDYEVRGSSCGCNLTPPSSAWLAMLLPLLLWRRR